MSRQSKATRAMREVENVLCNNLVFDKPETRKAFGSLYYLWRLGQDGLKHRNGKRK